MRRKSIIAFLMLLVLLTSCSYPKAAKQDNSPASAKLQELTKPVVENVPADEPTTAPQPTSTFTPEVIPTDQNPENPPQAPQGLDVGGNSGSRAINPLTGLPVEDPGLLGLPPALISVTNWPTAARPQAGLSFSPIIFELYIGEGMSRFLAVFYGDFPPENLEGDELLQTDQAEIGPIRSGRLPYESLRSFYNGFLVMASAYKGVASNLSQRSNIFGSDADDINSAMIPVSSLEDISREYQNKTGTMELGGNVFDPVPPANGKEANQFWYIYNIVDQIAWKYDPSIGSYYRYQDNADGKTFIQASDRLTGAPLTMENVVVLFADHRACTEVAYDIDLMYIDRMPALLFRDGQVYEIFWTTSNEEYEQTTGKLRPIRFIDREGNPISLKPGQTWVHLTPSNTPYWEATDIQEVPQNSEQWISENPEKLVYNLLNNKEPGSGNWVMRYFASMITYDEAVCEQLKK